MLQWGFPQFYRPVITPMPMCNIFSTPINPFMQTFNSVFMPAQIPVFPAFNMFQRPAFFNPFQQIYRPLDNNFLMASLPKPQGIKSTLINWYDSAVDNTKKVINKGKETVKKGYEYAKKGYNYVKASVKDLMDKIGYNAEKGQRLAQEAKKGAAGRFKGKCATYVKKAVENANLGEYKYGVHGKDMARVYGQNKNFKRISAKGINVKDLPAGCILCYEAGKSGHHKVYGHTGITQGNGTEISDGITRNPKEASYILVPV